MEVISYGTIIGSSTNAAMLMAGRRKCSDCNCDDDECPSDCFDCWSFNYCEDDCGCDDGADCRFADD